MTDYGPQYPRDDELTARMRFHQSWWRVHRLHQAECGTDARGRKYGNYLTEAAAYDGWNFLTDQIFGVARDRIAQGPGVEPFRCLRNLLSSQPMAFNLFGPLVADPELARVLLDPLLPGGVSAAEVEIEWAPPDRAAHLNDATSFDVVVRYTTADGHRAIAGIETKLTEPFSQKSYDTGRYRDVARTSTVWRDPDDPALANTEWNQLWRNHLLVESIRQQPGTEYERGCEIVVHHPADQRCIDAVAGYQELLAEPDSVRALSPATIVDAWRPRADDLWIERFHDRYLDLDLSAEAWEQWSQPRPSRGTRPNAAPPAVTAGHRQSLAMFQDTNAVRTTLERYRESAVGAEVYLRPTDAGLVVISLDAERCTSMVGVGARKTKQHVLTSVPPSPAAVTAAAAGYADKLHDLGRQSDEECFALRCIRHALGHGLRLPEDDVTLLFLAQEWRLPALGNSAKIDLLALDPVARQLVVIECKASEAVAIHGDGRELTAAEQSQRYADEIWRERGTLYPFFEELGRALRAIYAESADVELALDASLAPQTLVWWPGNPIP